VPDRPRRSEFREVPMTIDSFVLAFAGSVILASLILSQLHSVWWLLLAGLIALNMLQAAFTCFCPFASILRKLGFRTGSAFE
jgi:hypothetical protein